VLCVSASVNPAGPLADNMSLPSCTQVRSIQAMHLLLQDVSKVLKTE
jgi:hypothetical protein